LRLVTSLRGDHYQVPIDPGGDTALNRDIENERDAFANFSWVHTGARGLTLTLSPFYHFNRAHYVGKFAGTFDGDPDHAVAIPRTTADRHFSAAPRCSLSSAAKHNARCRSSGLGTA